LALTLPPLKDIITRHGLQAKKSLGQHFLLDENICARIAIAAGNLSGCTVIEIGPGPGGLTRALLQAGASVIAIEKDQRCVGALEELRQVFPERLSIIEADALEADLPALAPAPRKIVANLPYNIGTALLLKWLDDVCRAPDAYQSMTLMFQREVAGRISAEPGGKDYGRLSVFAQWLCETGHHFDLPPGAFSPPPKIYSSVITLAPRPKPLYPANKDVLEKVVAAAFGQRRKMLRSALKGLRVDTEALLEKAGIDGTRRGETLSVEEFCALAAIYASL